MQHLLGLGERQNAVVGGHLIEGALQRAFRAGAVVAADIDDQRVVELAHVLDCLDDAADLMVRVGGIAGKVLRLAGIELLLDEPKRIPLRQLRTAVLGLPSGHGVSVVSGGITPSRF